MVPCTETPCSLLRSCASQESITRLQLAATATKSASSQSLEETMQRQLQEVRMSSTVVRTSFIPCQSRSPATLQAQTASFNGSMISMIPMQCFSASGSASCGWDRRVKTCPARSGRARAVRIFGSEGWRGKTSRTQLSVSGVGSLGDDVRLLRRRFDSMKTAIRSWGKYVPWPLGGSVLTSGNSGVSGTHEDRSSASWHAW